MFSKTLNNKHSRNRIIFCPTFAKAAKVDKLNHRHLHGRKGAQPKAKHKETNRNKKKYRPNTSERKEEEGMGQKRKESANKKVK